MRKNHLKILWGPFDHQALDLSCQQQLNGFALQSFGPYGADLICKLPSQPASGLAGTETLNAQPDAVLLIEPLLRPVPAMLFQLDCPIIAISSVVPDAATAKLFDALIPLMRVKQDFENLNPFIGRSWMPNLNVRSTNTLTPLYDLVCIGSGLTPDLFAALESLWPQTRYLQGLDCSEARQFLLRSHWALIPSLQPCVWHAEALNAGASLLIPDSAALIDALALNPEQFQTYQPDQTQTSLCSLNLSGTAPSGDFEPEALSAILSDVLATLSSNGAVHTSFNLPDWQGYLAAPSLQSHVSVPAQEASDAALSQIISVIQRQPDRESDSLPVEDLEQAAQTLAQLWQDFLRNPAKVPVIPWIAPLQPHQIYPCWSKQTGLSQHLHPLHFDALTLVRLWLRICSLTPHAIRPKALQVQHLITEVWPEISHWLTQYPDDLTSEWAEALLQAMPWQVNIRTLLARVYLSGKPAQAQTIFVEQTLSLLSRSPVWRNDKPELLTQLLHGLTQPKIQSDKVSVWFEGPVYNYSSFARVNAALLQAWQSSEQLEVILAQTAVQAISPTYPDLKMKPPYHQPEVMITHHFPHRETLPLDIPRIAIMPWEFGIPPKHSAEIVREEIDETWVPSRFSLETYVRAGADPERLFVIPNGVDTGRYCPQGPVMTLNTRKRFRFCYVGATIPRKGFDILLKTYLQTFGPEDDVCLVIKDFGAKEQYAGNSMYEHVLRLSQDKTQPEIIYMPTDFMPEDDLISLFRACDVFVHPYRGEGFGMGILEAMACGLPVIIPNQGPAPEFCPEAASWQIYCLTRFLHQTHYFNIGALERYTELPSFKLEPEPYFLAQAMRAALAGPELCKTKGQAAREAALVYDWQQIARQAEARVVRLARQTPRRSTHLPTSTIDAPQARDLPLLWTDTRALPQLRVCPIYADFAFFHPFIQPQTQGKPYGILAVLEDTQAETLFLQTLIQAFGRLQVGTAQVQLIFAAPTAQLQPLRAWVQDFCHTQPHIAGSHKFVFQNLPEDPEGLKRLYQQATLFVNTAISVSGHWHLLAQAMGVRCLSGGGQAWLERPYCETTALGDVLHLSWLLSKLLPSAQTIFDGLAVREHLKSRYDRQQIQRSG